MICHQNDSKIMGDAVEVCFGSRAKVATVILIYFYQVAATGAYFVLIGQNMSY